MSKQKLLFASLGLTACMCWAMTSSLAESPNAGGKSPSPGGVLSVSDPTLGSGTPGLSDANEASHEDPGYLGLFGVARLEDVLPDDNPMANVTLLDEREYRVLAPGQLRAAPDAEEPGTRGDSACNNIAYNNQVGTFVSITSINRQFGLVDDCRLAPAATDRFICSASVRTFGNAEVGGPVYDLTISVYSDCPDVSGSILVASGSYANIPNDSFYRIHTVDVSPDYFDSDGIIWVGAQSNNADAFFIIAGNTIEVGDIGATANSFAIPNGAEGCDLFAFVGGTAPWGGMSITLRGTQGPLGCCCNTLTAVKAPSLAGACDNYTQSWFPTDCASAPACNLCAVSTCTIAGPGNLENEPDCTTNYTDVTNRGCADLNTFEKATSWTAIAAAPANGCGRTGTYTFLNGTFTEGRRDQDSYLLILTQDSRVTWKVRGNVPMESLVGFTLRQTNAVGPLSCGIFIATGAGDTSIAAAPACTDAIATACLPGRDTNGGFRYILRARPGINTGIPCTDASYQWEVSTAPCTFPAYGACCTPTGCIETSPLGCLIGFNQYQGDNTTCVGLPVPCVGVPPNDVCTATKIIFSNTVDVRVTFDTTFANSETVTYGQSGTVYKDIWYEYRPPSIGSATSGRIAVSTIGTCFNSKVVLLQVRNTNFNSTQTVQCGAAAVLLRGFGTPVVVTATTPPLPIAGFTYVRGNANVPTNTRIKIRVGGISEDEFGAGTFGITWIPDDTSGVPWNLSAGRCCLPGGGCIVTPADLAPPADDTTPDNCLELGGFLTNVTNFQQGNASETNTEFAAVGCGSWPCPVDGEACWNALDFNTLVGGGFGTITRATVNVLYVKYTVPPSTPIGSAIVVNTCGSINFGINLLDTSIAVYKSFNVVSGECDGSNNAILGDNDDCGSTDTSSAGAADRAVCYGGRGGASCLCFQVVNGTPGFGQLKAGDTYWIAIGAANGLGGSYLYVDPRRNDCGGPVTFNLQITNPASCFTCVRPACVGTAEGETTCESNYVDTYNAGCSAYSPTIQNFLPSNTGSVSCGTTYCGQSATYRINNPCLDDTDCAAIDACTPPTGGGICLSTLDNTRDFDWYRTVVTTPTRLSYQVSADFPATVQIISSPNATASTNSCVGTSVVATVTTLDQCATTLVEADVCPGVYYLVVTVATESGTPCDGQRAYTATLTCGSPSTLATACCKGDMNNDGRLNAADIQAWVNQLRQPIANLEKDDGCFNLLTCRADFTNDYAVSIADLSGFVATLVGKPVCPPAVCGEASSCHLPAADDIGAVSDMGPGLGGNFRVADDFRVSSAGASQQITKVCWWGFYFDFSNLIGCAPAGGFGDNFSIAFYNDASGLPGTKVVPVITGLTISKTDTGVDLNYLGVKVRRFRYEATLPVPVSVVGGNCYWMEITNNTTTCRWLWETSKTGNAVTGQKNGGPAGKENWSTTDLSVTQDQSWCLEGIRTDSLDCGLPLGRCCVYPGQFNCSITTKTQCEQVLNGVWLLNGNCSSNPPCPVLPANDSCPNAQLVTANALYSGSTFFATKDANSVPMSCEASCGSQCNSAFDVWFKWENNDPAFGGPIPNPTFSMCDVGNPPNQYDAMMVVYTDCPTNGGFQALGGCNDDGCGASGPSRCALGTTVGFEEPTGTPPFCTPGPTGDCYRTYYIRISGWQGTNGNFNFKVFKP